MVDVSRMTALFVVLCSIRSAERLIKKCIWNRIRCQSLKSTFIWTVWTVKSLPLCQVKISEVSKMCNDVSHYNLQDNCEIPKLHRRGVSSWTTLDVGTKVQWKEGRQCKDWTYSNQNLTSSNILKGTVNTKEAVHVQWWTGTLRCYWELLTCCDSYTPPGWKIFGIGTNLCSKVFDCLWWLVILTY